MNENNAQGRKWNPGANAGKAGFRAVTALATFRHQLLPGVHIRQWISCGSSSSLAFALGERKQSVERPPWQEDEILSPEIVVGNVINQSLPVALHFLFPPFFGCWDPQQGKAMPKNRTNRARCLIRITEKSVPNRGQRGKRGEVILCPSFHCVSGHGVGWFVPILQAPLKGHWMVDWKRKNRKRIDHQ